MRYVCPKDVKKMLLVQARSTHWRKWGAKHENEELKEGIWLELALTLLRKKTKKGLTDNHRNVARQFWFWKEAGCRKNSSTLVGQMKASTKHATKKEQKSTGSTIDQKGTRSDVRCPEASRKWEQKANCNASSQ